MLAAIGVLVAVTTSSAIAAAVSGAGATFPYPIYAKWADAYKKETGIAVNYQSIGSGEGIRMIQNKEVIFGTSDMPLKAADLDMHGLVQFPTVIGGVVAVVNVEGIKAGGLILDGPTLAKIFLGEIKSWNNAALRKLNPSVKAAVAGNCRGTSLRRLRHDLRLHRLSRQDERGLEVQGRSDHLRRLARRHRGSRE